MTNEQERLREFLNDTERKIHEQVKEQPAQRIQTEVRPHAVRDYLASRNESSRETYRRALRRALSVVANCEVTEIKPEYLASDEVIQNFQNMTPSALIDISRKLQKRYSQRTSAQAVTAIKGVIKYMYMTDAIDSDQYLKVNMVDNPKIPKDSAERRFLDNYEIKELKRVCNQDKTLYGKRDLAILEWALFEGPRCSEVVNVNLEDYNRRTGVIMIRNSKGMKSRDNTLKNGAKKAMEEWIRARGKTKGALFSRIRRSGDNLKNLHLVHENMSSHSIVLMLRKRAKQANLKIFTPHALRRTSAELQKERGKTLIEIAETLGHADINTTRNAYLRQPGQRTRRH